MGFSSMVAGFGLRVGSCDLLWVYCNASLAGLVVDWLGAFGIGC